MEKINQELCNGEKTEQFLIEVEDFKESNEKIFTVGDIVYSTERNEFLFVSDTTINDTKEKVLKLSRLLPSKEGLIYISEKTLQKAISTVEEGKHSTKYIYYPKSEYKLVIQKK